MTNVDFTPEKFTKLKAAYNNAVKHNMESFVFDGSEWLTNYAKYAIEFLTPKFGGTS
tara:strand:- start:607 stop:777 length:171 start_codon:yes stop_codon:yes gene_type:complete